MMRAGFPLAAACTAMAIVTLLVMSTTVMPAPE
jgi:hypothetical protein